MKFKHQFLLEDANEHYRIYHADGSRIRIDFLEHMLRVAILKEGVPLTPTYSVRPRLDSDPSTGAGLPDFPQEGRDKLSTEGFTLLSPSVADDGKTVRFAIDDVNVSIDLFNFRMELTNEKGLLYRDRDYIAYNFAHELGDGSAHFISREEDEKIFGLGDKTGPVNKNKMSFRMEASDAMGFDAASSDPLYKQVPFFICENSNGSYGIYYDTYSNGYLNFGREINNYYAPFKSFQCDEENLVFYIILGNVGEIVTRFSELCGPLLFPPKWTFSYAGSTMSYTDADDADAQLRSFIDLCETYDLHPGGFYLSSGYTQIGDKRYVFHWNLDKIPSPEGLAAYYQAHGVEFFPNVKPAFLIDHPLYQTLAEKQWFLHYEDGSPAIFPFWDDYGSYLDFTNPDAFRFWADCVRRELVDKGYRNIWNDNNEYNVVDREVYAHGFGQPIKAHLIRPLFSFLMTMASLSAQDLNRRTVSVSRCGIAGLSRIATTWTGDNHTGFADFRHNHYMAMTMSLSGFFNFGQDIGGFAGPRPQEELFLRWIQYGIFTPRFVLHSWNPDKTSTMPWLYPHKMPTVQKLFALRDALVPYLYNEAYRSCCRHEPIIYPVFLKDASYDTESDVFFFGDSILAAPVFDEGATKITALMPHKSGGWYLHCPLDDGYAAHALPGDEGNGAFAFFKDGSPAVIKNTIDDLPVFFIKAGSVIPWQSEPADTRRKSLDGMEFVIYPLEEGSFCYSYLLDDGVSWLNENNHRILRFSVNCRKDTVAVSVSGSEDDAASITSKIRMVDARDRKLLLS